MATARRGKAAQSAAESAGSANSGDTPQPGTAVSLRVLKKYPNRRLYDTQTSSYITLADVKAMVLDGQTFEVRDAKTAEDITRSILLQIILEEETGGVPMFSTASLEQIIRFYGHAMQGVMGNYMEQSKTLFEKMQEQMTQAGALFPGIPGFPPKK